MKHIYFSAKQSRQVNRMFNEFQSCLPFKESSFQSLINETIDYVKALIMYREPNLREKCTDIFRANIKSMIGKYYMNGYRLNPNNIYAYTLISHPRMINPEYGYTPLETVTAIKAVRAFRDFAYSGFKDEDIFIYKLNRISGLLRD